MEKIIKNNDIYYTIYWSPLQPYDKFKVLGMNELQGILCLLEKKTGGIMNYLLFYGCWREGFRASIRNLFSPDRTKYPEISKGLEGRKVFYKYAVVDTNLLDIQDIMFKLIRQYTPLFNDEKAFMDSNRYQNIFLREKNEERFWPIKESEKLRR